MSKWLAKQLSKIHDGTGLFRARCNTPEHLCQMHNAACDAYEARIAELEAALARVKAESLRVVPVGEPVLFDHIQRDQLFVLMDGNVFVPDKLRCQMVRITDNQRVDVQQQFMDDVKFNLVRLERWEGGECT